MSPSVSSSGRSALARDPPFAAVELTDPPPVAKRAPLGVALLPPSSSPNFLYEHTRDFVVVLCSSRMGFLTRTNCSLAPKHRSAQLRDLKLSARSRASTGLCTPALSGSPHSYLASSPNAKMQHHLSCTVPALVNSVGLHPAQTMRCNTISSVRCKHLVTQVR